MASGARPNGAVKGPTTYERGAPIIGRRRTMTGRIPRIASSGIGPVAMANTLGPVGALSVHGRARVLTSAPCGAGKTSAAIAVVRARSIPVVDGPPPGPRRVVMAVGR